MIAFPSLQEQDASAQLDDMMNWYRHHPVTNAGCWSLHPAQPTDLDMRLLARGFQPGWRPCWMALDLQNIQTGYATPGNLQIQADNDTVIRDIAHLPYAGDNGAVSDALMKAHPDRAQRFIARLNGQIVGHSCILLTTGTYGVAGMYNVGVVPKARNKGIGKAVVTAACEFARQQGYHYAILNATGRRMYEQIGFKWIGNGDTWWLMKERYITHAPSPEQVALAEAIGRGDMEALNKPGQQFTTEDLNAPITNGMTLMQLATHCRQPAAAEWLLAHGAQYTVLDAWDMNWKDRAAALLAAHPEQANHFYGAYNTTLLHIAAERDDVALARLALQARPDLTLKDTIYNATALGWAQYLNRTEIVQMIQEAK